MKRLVIPLFAIAAVAYATVSVLRTHPHREASDPPAPPPVSHFPHTVAGVGLLEPSTENISIGTNLAVPWRREKMV